MNSYDSVPVIAIYGVGIMFALALLGAIFGVVFIAAMGIVLPAVLLMAALTRSTE